MDFEERGHSLIRNTTQELPEWAEKNHETPQNNRVHDQNSNRAPVKLKS